MTTLFGPIARLIACVFCLLACYSALNAQSSFRATPPSKDGTQTAQGWTWSFENDDYFGKRVALASVTGLHLLGCQCKYLTMEMEGFDEQPRAPHIRWIKWKTLKAAHEGVKEVSIPILMDDGEIGYSFVLNISKESGNDSIYQSGEFQICPKEGSQDKDCRHFTTLKFEQAVMFVCKRRND